jgi:hypothetical protein
MRITALGEAVSATAVAAQASVESSDVSPFLVGQTVVAEIVLAGAVTAAGVAKIQGSDDDSSWSDLLTSAGIAGKKGNITLKRYMRLNVTSGATGAGSTVSAYLVGN